MTADEGLPGYRGALQPNCVTIVQVLHSAGYRTAAVGKWHVGDSVLPTSRGFDDFYGFVRGYAVDSWEPRMMLRLPEDRPQRKYNQGEFFATDAITDHALDFLAAPQKPTSLGFSTSRINRPIFHCNRKRQIWPAIPIFTLKVGMRFELRGYRGSNSLDSYRQAPRFTPQSHSDDKCC